MKLKFSSTYFKKKLFFLFTILNQFEVYKWDAKQKLLFSSDADKHHITNKTERPSSSSLLLMQNGQSWNVWYVLIQLSIINNIVLMSSCTKYDAEKHLEEWKCYIYFDYFLLLLLFRL